MIFPLIALLFSLTLFAQESEDFKLGTIDVVARRMEAGEITHGQVASSVTKKEMQENNRQNVGDALNLLSGVTMSTNARNEKIISVRGFDSRQVPLFIDGIPVYVPFDGYVDFNRFTTADLASIQVAKGFSSVAYGPNTLGGAINLISRKPRKPFEADLSLGTGNGDQRRASTNLGTNQGLWYLQTGASYLESDFFPLSSDFKSTPTENGGHRDNSFQKDHKLSVKVGFTPKSGDEYALSYYQQSGEKGQPPSTDPTRARYWKWPFWNKQSLYFVSQTAVSEKELFKVRLYHDEFDNKITSFTDGTYSVPSTTGSNSVSTGASIYHDRTNGGSLTLETYRLENHSLTLVTHFKADEHKEYDNNGLQNTLFKDNLISIAAEDSIKLSDYLTASLGVSHHDLRPEHVFSRGNAYSVPRKQEANEWQGGLFFDPTSTSQFYGTVARKTRMPTLKDRYSQRLGTFVPNQGLKAEQSLNLEVGYKASFWGSSSVEAALFHNDLRDKIQTVLNAVGTKSQVQNVDKVRLQGVELGFKSGYFKKVELGGNFTYTHIKDLQDSSIKIIDVPRQKIQANGTYRPSTQVGITPFLEYNSGRWSSNTKELPGFVTINLKLAYTFAKGATLDTGVTNLTDRNYSLAQGFPSAGRMYFVNGNFEL
jgi:iron complex outermembrane recepter protein